MSKFAITTKIYFGDGATEEALAMLRMLGYSQVMFLADAALVTTPAMAALHAAHVKAGFSIQSVQSYCAKQEPSYDELDRVTDSLRALPVPDVIVAVGGGTVLDLAKGVGILLKNPGKGLDYRGMDKVQTPGVPVVCFPATAGTGSEVTHTASFIDTKTQTKLGINGRFVAPLCGVLVPALTLSCPRSVTLYAGLDAMLHALEAATAKTATALTVRIGADAFALLFENLPLVLRDPQNETARANVLLGSYWAGVAMMNAGGGPASGISYPLGVHFSVPHGLAGGIFLAPVAALNVSRGYTGYVPVYDRLPGSNSGLSDAAKSSEFARKLVSFYRELGGPATLQAFGVTRAQVTLLTQLTMDQRVANLELNPVPVSRADVEQLLQSVTI